MPDFESFGKIPRLRRNCVITEKLDGCLNGSTRILMSDHSYKSISAVREGDEVLGVDEDGRVVPTLVTKTWNHGSQDEWMQVTGLRLNAGRGDHRFSVKCTPNHKFWNPERGAYVAASELSEGDAVLTARTELALTPLQRSILLGKLLGDGTVGRSTANNWHVSWAHTLSDAEYTNWTLRAVGDIGAPSTFERTSGYGSSMYGARTVTSLHIREEFEDFFDEGNRKIVPSSIVTMLDPIALAVWYMDDGSLAHDSGQEDRVVFATNGFDKESCINLQLALDRLGIASVLYESKGWCIRLTADNAERLFLLVAPYVPPVMSRKLPVRYRGGPGWLPALTTKDYKPQLTPVRITSIRRLTPIPRERVKYDLTTGTHNFFANRILVHNSNAQVLVVPVLRDDTDALLYATSDDARQPLDTQDKLVALEMWGEDEYAIFAGSRKRWITPDEDNYGFARWVKDNSAELVKLGEGRHFGEWWGRGVQRGYDQIEKRFSLFNTGRWDGDNNPPCTSVVPVLAEGVFTTDLVESQLERLRTEGSIAAPGFMRPEGVIVYQIASGTYAKVLLENDDIPKTVAEAQ